MEWYCELLLASLAASASCLYEGGGRCLVRATAGGGSWPMPSSSISYSDSDRNERIPMIIHDA